MKRYIKIKVILFPTDESSITYKHYKVKNIASIINQLIDGIRKKNVMSMLIMSMLRVTIQKLY